MTWLKALGCVLSMLALSPGAFADQVGKSPRADVNEAEPNGTCAEANNYELGDVYHGFLSTNDHDWVNFIADAGDVVTAGTAADGPDTVDTIIELYAVDCQTLIASDDNSAPDGSYSFFQEFLPFGGSYFLRVRPSGASTGNYKLVITADPPVSIDAGSWGSVKARYR
jgi:hypothetical protein